MPDESPEVRPPALGHTLIAAIVGWVLACVEPAADEEAWTPDLAHTVLAALLGWVATLALLAAVVVLQAGGVGPELARLGRLLAYAVGAGLGAGAAFAATELSLRARRPIVGLLAGVGLTLLAPLGGEFEAAIASGAAPAEAATRTIEAARSISAADLSPLALGLAALLPVVVLRARDATIAQQLVASGVAGCLAFLARAATDARSVDSPAWLTLLLLAGVPAQLVVALAVADRLLRRVRGRPAPPPDRRDVARALVAFVLVATGLLLALSPADLDEPAWAIDARVEAALARDLPELVRAARGVDLRRRWGFMNSHRRFVRPPGPSGSALDARGLLGRAQVDVFSEIGSGLQCELVVRLAIAGDVACYEDGWELLQEWDDDEPAPEWVWRRARAGCAGAWKFLAHDPRLSARPQLPEVRAALLALARRGDLEALLLADRVPGDDGAEIDRLLLARGERDARALDALLGARRTADVTARGEAIAAARSRTDWPAQNLVVRLAGRVEASPTIVEAALRVLRVWADEELRIGHGRVACRRALADLLARHSHLRLPEDEARLPDDARAGR